ncbi:MAG: methyltransferase domain-containing protein [Deltaproteobacteria bacterium]|nr:methyltransferase domain-containing protein [Deltaproteobacteria bacterium]
MALTAALELLAEPQRARLLRVLEAEELAVGDLARVVALPQSTVSRHLKSLAVAGWLHRRSAGTTALVRMAVEALAPEALELWRLVRDDPDQQAEREADRGRLALVLAERAADAGTFFGRMASGWDALRDQLFGRGFVVPAALGLLPPDVTIADLGSGTGELALRLAPFARAVVGVDREPSMVAAARQRLAGHDHVRFVEAPLEALPLPDASVDLALVVLVLHHVPEPARALAEAARILRPGGRLVVVDMQPHDNDAWRAFGHVHRGFSEAELDGLVAGTGLARDRLVPLPPDADAQGPPLFVASFQRVAPESAPRLAKAKRAR